MDVLLSHLNLTPRRWSLINLFTWFRPAVCCIWHVPNKGNTKWIKNTYLAKYSSSWPQLKYFRLSEKHIHKFLCEPKKGHWGTFPFVLGGNCHYVSALPINTIWPWGRCVSLLQSFSFRLSRSLFCNVSVSHLISQRSQSSSSGFSGEESTLPTHWNTAYQSTLLNRQKNQFLKVNPLIDKKTNI